MVDSLLQLGDLTNGGHWIVDSNTSLLRLTKDYCKCLLMSDDCDNEGRNQDI